MPACSARARSRAARSSSTPTSSGAAVPTTSAAPRNVPATCSARSSCTSSRWSASTRSALVSATTPCAMPSSSRMRRCSSRLRLPAFGRGDDEQARVDRADSREHVLDEADVAGHVDERDVRRRTAAWSHAKPRSIVSPRRFSSAKRSGSVPVSARTSVDLPWSTWPAVATTRVGGVASLKPAPECRCERGIVHRIDGAQVADRGVVVHAGDDRERDRGAQRRRVIASEPRRRPTGSSVPGSEPAPATASRLDDLAGVDRLGPGSELADGDRRHAPERDRVAVTAEVRERGRLQGGEGEPTGSQRPGERVASARVDDVAATGDDARLRSAEELVARERDQLRRPPRASDVPRGSPLSQRRATRQPRTRSVEQARADVDDDRHTQRRQLGHLDCLR